MNINDYLAKQYSLPPCFDLVADVYMNELHNILPQYKSTNSSFKAIANAFRIALHNNEHGFVQVESPVDYCVVLMAKLADANCHHIGVYYEGKVLHALPSGNLYQDISSIRDQFKRVEYWVKRND